MEVISKVKIEKLDHLGRGIIRDKGIIFVTGALKDDVVDIEIVKNKKGIREAKVIKFYERTKDYRVSCCPYSKECGGCDFISLNYQEQLNYKKEKVQELIDRMLKEKINVKDIITSNQDFNYRNKILLHGEGKKLGLYKEGSHHLIEIDKCQLVNPEINKIIEKLKKYLQENDILIYDVMIRVTNYGKMLYLHGRLDYEHFKKYFNDIDVININEQLVTKEKSIKEEILNKKFYISPQSFFQVNRYTTPLLYDKVISLIKDKNYNNCLDLYCGTGTISILVSDYVKKVYGIEIIKEAINDANKNKELNEKNNVEFILGKVEDYLDNFNNIDLIIVDPPREGLDNLTRNSLQKIKAKTLIYVSCDPVTLMRDLNDLKKDYNIEEISICDMFPNTYHVESVCVLKLNKNL